MHPQQVRHRRGHGVEVHEVVAEVEVGHPLHHRREPPLALGVMVAAVVPCVTAGTGEDQHGAASIPTRARNDEAQASRSAL